jgi:hypothetical protein
MAFQQRIERICSHLGGRVFAVSSLLHHVNSSAIAAAAPSSVPTAGDGFTVADPSDFVFSEEVERALAANLPVVALESTIISHGV